MSAPQRVTIEQIIGAYESTGSVWKAAKVLGIVGQSVWERLKAINYPLPARTWTVDEITELGILARSCTISDIAQRLGRPYYGVAIKLSRLGLANRGGNRKQRAIPRGSGFTKPIVLSLCKELAIHSGSLRQFCRMKSIDIEVLVQAIQKYNLDFWKVYSKDRSDLNEKPCVYCGAPFYPMTAKQVCCTRKCSATMKRDNEYFGGRRRDTVGLSDGICQLCNQEKPNRLSSHHVLGKQNDPDNQCLVALCPGCHQLVGQLAGRKFVDQQQGWENLVQLVMARRMADKSQDYIGVYACLDMEYLTAKDVADMTN